MGQDKTVVKVGPGQFTDVMTWLVYTEVKKPSGAIEKSWIDGNKLFASVMEDSQISDDEKYQDIKRRKLVFITWNSTAKVGSRVKYNGLVYVIDTIVLKKRGLYAEYTCMTGNGD